MNRKINLSLAYLKKKWIHYLGIFFVMTFTIVALNVPKIVDYNLQFDYLLSSTEDYGNYNIEFKSKEDLSGKLKDDKKIKNFYVTSYLGDIRIDDQNGSKYKYSSKFYLFSPTYLKERGYKLIEGRYPSKTGEILLEKKYCQKLNKGNILGESVVFRNDYGYAEEKQIFYEKYKVVGILERDYKMVANKKIEPYSDAFAMVDNEQLKKYNNNSFMHYVEFYDGFENINIHKKELETSYKGISDVSESRTYKAYNMFNDSKKVFYKIKENSFVLIVSLIFIICIYILLEKEMIRDMGKLRLIALSKKSSDMIIVKIYSILSILSNLAGLFLSYLVSYIILNYFKHTSDITDVYVFVQFKYMLFSILTLDALVFILNIYLILKTRNLSISEQISYKYVPKIFRGFFKHNVLLKFFERSIASNLIVFIAIVSTAISGIMYVRITGIQSYGDPGKVSAINNAFGRNEYALNADFDVVDPYINNADFMEWKNIDGVENLLARTYMDSYINFSKDRLTKEYLSFEDTGIESNDVKVGMQLELIDINDYTSKEIERFLSSGSSKDIGTITEDGYINVAIMNSIMKGSFYSVVKDLKVGDKYVLNVIKGDGVEQKIKIRVAATIFPGWRIMGLSSGSLRMEVVSNFDSMNKLIGTDKISTVSFDILENEDAVKNKVNNRLKEIGLPFTVSEKKELMENAEGKFIEINNSIRILSMFVISGVSMGSAIYTILENRKKEIRTLIDLGSSKLRIIKINIMECIAYTILMGIIMVPIAISDNYEFYLYLRDVVVYQTGVKGLIPEVYTPPIQIYIYFLFILAMNIVFGSLSTYLSIKKNFNTNSETE